VPTIIRNLRGIDTEVKTKNFNSKIVEFTENDRRFIDALNEFYTQGKSDLLDSYQEKED